MQITPYRAGHVLGAALFMVEVAGLRCLYTGAYSRAANCNSQQTKLSSPDAGRDRRDAFCLHESDSRRDPRRACRSKFYVFDLDRARPQSRAHRSVLCRNAGRPQ